MLMTVLNAFSERPPIGAKKLPAAPEAYLSGSIHIHWALKHTTNDKVNFAEFLDGFSHSVLELLWLSNICLNCKDGASCRIRELFGGLRIPLDTMKSS